MNAGAVVRVITDGITPGTRIFQVFFLSLFLLPRYLVELLLNRFCRDTLCQVP